ncbi:MAG: caspase family protein [Leptolyngbya sp. SIO1E4]|nr:caspase family protein [Leptolyngbya sp. SIO1E4]
MPQHIQRRHFLQLAGGTLATLGLSQLDFYRQARQYDRALAQPTRRKLALLVGINRYPSPIPSLRGCLTDVELQYELLVHRYGFNPRDILVVSDSALTLPGQAIVSPPTRQNILTAFETHLIEQAQPGDVVLFHYSGHGAYVLDDNGIPEFSGLNGTLLPYDGRAQGGDRVDDIMGKTLFLLSLALPTEYVTLVLDSCHSGGGVRGNQLVRAFDTLNARPSDRELAYQTQWMSRLNLTPAELQTRRQQGIAKGVALGSAQISQLSSDAAFDGFYAGAFTYLLTRYLWQLPTQQPLSDTFVNLARSTRTVANTSGIAQDPIYAIAPDRAWDTNPTYLLSPAQLPAEAVIRSLEGDQVVFWLGGMSVNNLSTQQAVFSLVDDRGHPVGEVLQTERNGLVGRGTLNRVSRQQPQPGQLMREQIRGVPLNLTLRVGLDPSLTDESADALATLNAISRVEGVPVTQEIPIDYLLARFTEAVQAQAQQHQGAIAATLNSIGLLTPDLTPVPDTVGVANEPLPEAIQRLRPRFKMLLAGKMLSTLINSSASGLTVETALLLSDRETVLLSVGSRSAQEAGQTTQGGSSLVQLSAGTEIQIQVKNYEPRDLFISVLSIASTGEMAILHPVVWDAPDEAARILAGQTLRVPSSQGGRDRFRFVARGPAGFFELMVLASTEPLQAALRSLQTIARGRGTRSGNPLQFAEGRRGTEETDDAPVDVVDALLSDLDRGARGGLAVISNSQRVDTQHLAAFSMVIEVVD